mgnify:FL=1
MTNTPVVVGGAQWLVALIFVVLAPPMALAQVDTGDGAVEQPLGSRRSDLSEPGVPSPAAPQGVEISPVAPESVQYGATQFRLHVREFRFEGNTVISTAQLQAVAAPYQGREITDVELQELRRELTALYTEAGYVASAVVVPDQDIIDGVVTLRAV